MKAILIPQPGKFSLIDLPVPEPDTNQVLVKIESVSLCNQHDIKVWTGGYKKLSYLEYNVPGFPGHEGAGVVVKTGKNFSNIKIGDRVVLSGLGGPPLYQEYVLRDPSEIVKIPDSLDFDSVAMTELLGCVHRGVTKVTNWKDKNVLVTGLGPAGLAAIQIIKAYGAKKIIVSDIIKEKLLFALEYGADKAFNANDPDYIDQLKNENPDIVYETTGNVNSYNISVNVANQAVILFSFTEKQMTLDPYPIFDKELAIYGSKWLTVQDMQKIINLMDAGKIDTKPLISQIFSFKEYEKAIKFLQTGQAIKVIMHP